MNINQSNFMMMKKLTLIMSAAAAMLLAVSCGPSDANSYDENKVDSQLTDKNFVLTNADYTATPKETKAGADDLSFDIIASMLSDVLGSITRYNIAIQIGADASFDFSYQMPLVTDMPASFDFAEFCGAYSGETVAAAELKIFTDNGKVYFGVGKAFADKVYAGLKTEFNLTPTFKEIVDGMPVLVDTGNYYAVQTPYTVSGNTLTFSVNKNDIVTIMTSVGYIVELTADKEDVEYVQCKNAEAMVKNILDSTTEFGLTFTFQAQTVSVN